jgi:hypothetical protein
MQALDSYKAGYNTIEQTRVPTRLTANHTPTEPTDCKAVHSRECTHLKRELARQPPARKEEKSM